MAFSSVALTFVLLQQAPAPSPAPAVAPPPAQAPAVAPPPAQAPAPAEMPPAVTPAPAATDAPPPAAVPANPAHWRVENVQVAGGGAETRVLKSNDEAVSVGEGLADVKLDKRLAERARKMEGTQTSWETILGRVAVLCAGGVLLAGGVVAAAVGAGFFAWSRVGAPEGLPTQVNALVQQGASIFVTGLAASAIGLFMVGATGALWAYFIYRGPPPADPAVVQALGAQLAWETKEADEVVQKHNAAVDGAPAPTPAVDPANPAPAPATDPASTAPISPAPVEPAPSAAPAQGVTPAPAVR